MTTYLITTPVTGSIHPRCGTPVLTGTVEGLGARVDLVPLNRNGEIHALCAGLQTYTLTRAGLVHRDATRIAGTSLTRAGPVLAEHQCGRHIPATHRDTTPPARAAVDPDRCPF